MNYTKSITIQPNSGDVMVCLGELPTRTLERALETDDCWVGRPLRTLLNDHINDTDRWLRDNPEVRMPDLEPMRLLLIQMAIKITQIQKRHKGRFHKFEGQI